MLAESITGQHTLEVVLSTVSSVLLTIASFFMKSVYAEFKELKKDFDKYKGESDVRLTRLETVNEFKQ